MQAGCTVVFIDGVPHLRLGKECGLQGLVGFHLASDAPPVAENLSLEPSSRQLALGVRSVPLTRTEYRLVEQLHRADGDLCDYGSLVDNLWPGRAIESGQAAARALVAGIRIKLRAAGLPDYLIVSVHGKGLRLHRT
jgi:DNA-binding response OmpR family regulator